MVFGLGLLLLSRLLLFAAAGLGNQGLLDAHSVLPVLDRAVTASGLILIIWLWAFPEPQKAADAASALLILLTLTCFALSLVWWADNQVNTFFNQIWLDTAWEIFALTLLGLGLLTLIIRRPNGYGFGLTILLFSILGHSAHFVLPASESDFPGLVRLAQLAAYPWLLALPQRFRESISDHEAVPIPQAHQNTLIQERPRYTVAPETFQAILSLGGEKSFQQVCQNLSRTVAEALLADVSLVILPPDREGRLMVQCGYDLIRQEFLGNLQIESRDVPLLATAMQRSRPLRLPASSTSRDLFSLGQILNFGRTGHLLAAFVPKSEAEALIGVVLLSPYSNRRWTSNDQDYLNSIVAGLAQILQRSKQWHALSDELATTRQNLQAFQALLEETQNENASLRMELGNISEEAFAEQQESIMTLATSQQDAHETIARLQTENKRLESVIAELLETQEELPQPQSDRQLEEELRLSLAELARLKTQLSEADHKLLEMQHSSSGSSTIDDDQVEVFTSIAQELRQPMSSIVGYTDLLLGESVGILGALQRKFLERIKASTNRMEALLEDLLQVTELDPDNLEFSPEQVDLGLVIDEAIAATRNHLRDRNIVLRVDLPKQLPQLHADHDAVQQILIHLLKNAEAASPIDGEVFLRASIYQSSNQEDYVLIQVADQGGGIPAQDLPRVFSRLYRADNPLIEGIGDTGVGLSIAKTLVEAHHGRIWVDSQPGEGATFSILLPLSNGQPYGAK